jgi:hypothetical protein
MIETNRKINKDSRRVMGAEFNVQIDLRTRLIPVENQERPYSVKG